eukprot:TRINITY_DN18872_c0_g1_i1.p1 TRINITY_DN18872_c0_g1~~TRINITY_DN18872_c0_g1_i1.p1  ORF type:complete len:971 (+),score=252.86 TRINITY_DN18872_c0_g1_i1:152-2914(+)
MVRMDKSKPLSTYTKQICTKLGVDSLEGLTLYSAKLGSLTPTGDPLDLANPVPCPPTARGCALYVRKGDAPLPAAAKKPGAKAGKKPGTKPASPKAAAKPGGKAAGKASPKASPKATKSKASPPPNPTGTKGAKPAGKASPPPNPTGKGKTDKPDKEKKKKAATAAPAEEAAPPPIPVAPPPAFPGESLGLPQSPLVPPSSYRQPYQPYQSHPQYEENRKKLVEYYMKYNPSKISKVDSILAAFNGCEDKMWLELKERYEGPQAAARLSVASAIPLQQPSFSSSPQQPAVTLASIGKEQELRMKVEDEKMHSEMKNRVDSTLRELQEMRRREALEREERESRDRREREERDMIMKREMERANNDRRSVENLIKERQHSQAMREDEIERRDRELRKRQDDIAYERQEMKRRELDHQQFVANEEREMRARAERILSQTIGSTAPPVNGGTLLSKTPQFLSQLEDENAELRNELQKIQRSMEQQSIPQPSSAAKSPPPAHLQTPHSPGSPESGKESPQSPKKEGKYSPEFEPVAEQLERAGLQKYIPLLASHDFDSSAFRLVTDSDLKELGISAVGARKRIIAEAEKLRLAASVSSPKKLPTFDEHYSLINRGAVSDATPGYAESQIVNSKVQRVETLVDNLRNKVDVLANKSVKPLSQPPPPPPSPPRVRVKTQTSPVAQPSSLPNMSIVASSQALQIHHSVLTAFYQSNDAIKVPQVDQIVVTYQNNFSALYETLVDIYNIESSQYSDDVRKTCIKYFPGLEPAADILCRMCKGREAELVEQLILEGSGEPIGTDFTSISRWVELEHPEEKRTYYYNELAKVSQWAKPAAFYTKDRVAETVRAHAAPSSQKLPFSSVGNSSPPNPTLTEWQTRVNHYRGWLYAFLFKHDQKRLPEVDAIMSRYRGHEDSIPSAFQSMYAPR